MADQAFSTSTSALPVPVACMDDAGCSLWTTEFPSCSTSIQGREPYQLYSLIVYKFMSVKKKKRRTKCHPAF